MKISVIGVGQIFRGDDAVGIQAVKAWQAAHPLTAAHPSIHIEILNTPGINLLYTISDSDVVILVDALRSNALPGTIRHIIPDQLSHFFPDSDSAHGWGVAETLKLADTLGFTLPEDFYILGIEGAQFELGTEISMAVESCMGKIVDEIQNIIQKHLPQKVS